MKIRILKINQGITLSGTYEGLSATQCQELEGRLISTGGRYVIFPTTCQMLAWRDSVAGIGLEPPTMR